MPTTRRKKKAEPAKRDRLPYAMTTLYDEDLQRIKRLALDERTTVAELLRDGLNLILKSRKLPPLMTPNRNE
jgi:hypothetical protein